MALKPEIACALAENFAVYGARKVWRQMTREGHPIARDIVGWRVSRTAHASFVLDALARALHDRRPVHRGGLVHHGDRGSHYVSINYTERLAEAGSSLPSAASATA